MVEIISINYCFTLSVEDMRIIVEAENWSRCGGNVPETHLDEKLYDLPMGVTDVEYDERYGPSIFFTLPESNNPASNHEYVIKTIKNHVKLCHRLLAKSEKILIDGWEI